MRILQDDKQFSDRLVATRKVYGCENDDVINNVVSVSLTVMQSGRAGDNQSADQ